MGSLERLVASVNPYSQAYTAMEVDSEPIYRVVVLQLVTWPLTNWHASRKFQSSRAANGASACSNGLDCMVKYVSVCVITTPLIPWCP